MLPALLTGAMVWFDRWQARRGTRPEARAPVRPGALFVLAFIACLTHPALDWLNNYGVRLLEPFSPRWFYGDTLFIIDPWIIAMLGLGIGLSLRRERANVPRWRKPVQAALLGVCAYIFLNGGIGMMAVATGETAYRWEFDAKPDLVTANAVPAIPWRRQVLWRGNDRFGTLDYSVFDKKNYIGWGGGRIVKSMPVNMSSTTIAQWSQDDPAAQAFLFWSRMPVAELHPDRIVLRDQRFIDSPISDRFTVTLRSPK